MVTIKATFVGKDGSLGYRHDRRYSLHLDGSTIRLLGTEPDDRSACVYDSLQSFFENWTAVAVVKQ